MRQFNQVLRVTFIALVLSALSLQTKADIAIVNAKVYTMSEKGVLENATILIRDGKIQTVMEQTPALSGYEIIDASGKWVTPGLIGAYTSLGLVEVSSSAGTNDSRTEPTPVSATGAALDASYAVNPASTLFPVARIEGVTSAATGIGRSGQLFNGLGAFVSLVEDGDVLVKDAAFMATSVSNSGADINGGSRASVWVALEEALSEAEFASTQTLTPRTQWHGITSLADARALAPIVKGNAPLLIQAHRQADLLQVIALKQRRPMLNIVVLNASEGWMVADRLAAAKIPVILNPESNLPYEFDELAATLENAARLHKAGVMVAIGMNTHNIRLAKQHAGNAVSHGLPWEAGLASLTINPAKIYGVDGTLGSIERGKQADVVIWSGDPLEVTEHAEVVIINGQRASMTSRQSKLRDRYLKIEEGKTVHYQRP